VFLVYVVLLALMSKSTCDSLGCFEDESLQAVGYSGMDNENRETNHYITVELHVLPFNVLTIFNVVCRTEVTISYLQYVKCSFLFLT